MIRKVLLSLITASGLAIGFSGCYEKNIPTNGLMDDPICPKIDKENITKEDLDKSIEIRKEMIVNYEDIYSVYEDILKHYNETSEPLKFINEQNIEKINNSEIGGYLIALKMQKNKEDSLYKNILNELNSSNPGWCKKRSYITTIKEYKSLMRLK